MFCFFGLEKKNRVSLQLQRRKGEERRVVVMMMMMMMMMMRKRERERVRWSKIDLKMFLDTHDDDHHHQHFFIIATFSDYKALFIFHQLHLILFLC
jgi:hypothetical protein